MAKHLVKKGSTSRIEYVWISDSASAVGGGKTALAFNTASLTGYYVRAGAAATAITLATQTVTGAFSSGGFVEVDATNMPGLYRFDPPDAAFATGVGKVVMLLKGAADMAPVVLEYQLVDFDPENAASLGLTNLDATVSSRLATAGYTAPLDAAGTRAAVGLATANLDTQVGDIPTNAELATALTGMSTLNAAGVRSAVGLASADLDTQLGAIKADTAANKEYADNTVCRGTVSATAPTTTTFTSSAMAPAGVDADQFKGRIIVFDTDTTTTALRGQATDITANTAASNPLFTFTALTAAPQSGDTFSIV